ncbi:3-dehydroquinate synthase [Croceicoccus sp. F390]|uniref:3-dehydroquinate synthase n=1 Tax=Croceicoccus esteveae TaxID=3075597 RepID=A0ABU2ZF30_9SPHN|nr:3-dehydroquinate synthase [Croceicoccus sp. F390]MDT0575212.1 3-dehydroquinate synthase [Croceicoccus sp. F390]
MHDVAVALEGRAYDVRVGRGLIADIAQHCDGFLHKPTVPIITDVNVAQLYKDVVERSLAGAGRQARWLILPAGEATKVWQRLEQAVDFLLNEGVDRQDNIVALGGGVIGDLAGLAAAMVKRGCGFIQVPTTLLAQVDSSVGGKTAINTAAGKNLAGAFHQPSLVLADVAALSTLPLRELRAGYAEVVKYGLIGDASFFSWCERHATHVLGETDQTLSESAVEGSIAEARQQAIVHSVTAKARIVTRDERETTGERALLNLGHTFGHALEAETGYSDRLLHGEAVAVGMVLAARYSVRSGLMEASDADRISRHLSRSGLPISLAALELDCSGAQLADHMTHDKKMVGGNLPFVLMRGIGKAFLYRNVALADVAAFLDAELA